MIKTMLAALLVANFSLFGNLQNVVSEENPIVKNGTSGTVEKMIVANGNVKMDLDLNLLNGGREGSTSRLEFNIEKDAFFQVIVFNGELRGSLPSSMKINPQSKVRMPDGLRASYDNLLIEQMPFGEHYDLAVRDSKSGFTFFNVEGHLPSYDGGTQNFSINSGRVLVSKEFAQTMGRPELGGTTIGTVEINATMRAIEVAQLVDGETKSQSLPAGTGRPENAGTRPGPDVVVGDVFGLSQFGSSGTKVGLALGTTSCNYGEVNLNWFRLPDNDHPVIPQNLYRMSADGSRFEQIGQSQVKHAFTALTQNLCGLGCNGVGGSRLGSGCSDPYSAGLNAGPNLGAKAWINPFTGEYPRGDGGTSPNTHSGHSHNGTSHRILVEGNDLSTQMNVGAKYFAEGQYVTPHEYEWCQSNPGECNMNNNISYREYNVNGVSQPFSFSPVGSTVREKEAVSAWDGASFVQIQPDSANDGVGTLAYKVTETSPGVWHYEYAIYNQNLDRGIQSFSVPLGSGAVANNVGFHAPPQHPGSPNDGTMNDAGFSEAAWTADQFNGSGGITWSSETLAQNPNANAIRWGSMYNFRFDSDRPPQLGDVTVGFYKTGAPITVQAQVPSAPTAAAVTVSGRVTRAGGAGVRGIVSAIDGSGTPIYAYSNGFGYYTISGLSAGTTYTIGVSSKTYTFTPQTLQVDENLTGVNFVAAP